MPFINIDITSVRFICQVHFLFPFPYFFKLHKDYITLAIPNVLPKGICMG